MSGIFTKDQIVSITGGVKKSLYSNFSENKKFYIEEMSFKESKKLLEHINIYIRKYSKPGYRPDRYTLNFISKASWNKSSYYSIGKYFLGKENCEYYQKDDCIKLVQKLHEYKEALEKHQLNIKQTQDLQKQLLGKLNFYLKQDDYDNYEINSGSNNKDVFKEDDLGKLLDYKRLVERVGDYSQDFQIQLFDGIGFILAQEQEHDRDLGDVKKSIRENKINYNKDLSDILEFFQQHNIQLPDGQSEDYFKLIVDGSIFGSENLSNLRTINERIGADFISKKDELNELYKNYLDDLDNLDNKINEKHLKLYSLINVSPNDLEIEYINYSSDNNTRDSNRLIDYNKGYLLYLNKKIEENLKKDLKGRLKSNIDKICTYYNKTANELKGYICGDADYSNDPDLHPYKVCCPILFESYMEMIRGDSKDRIIKYKTTNSNLWRSISMSAYTNIQDVAAANKDVEVLCPFTRDAITELCINHQLVEILKQVDKSCVYSSIKEGESWDDYIKRLESKILQYTGSDSEMSNILMPVDSFSRVLKGCVSDYKRSGVLGPVNLHSATEKERNADIENIKQVLDILHEHSLFMGKSIGNRKDLCNYIASCWKCWCLNSKLAKIQNSDAKNKLKSVIECKVSCCGVKLSLFNTFLTFGGRKYSTLSKSAKNISDEYGKCAYDDDRRHFVGKFCSTDLSNN